MNNECLTRFKRGSGAMGSSFIDFYKCKDGIVRHRYGMGGQDKKIVKSIPDSIDEYVKVNEPANQGQGVMSNTNGIHHVVNDLFQSGDKSLCGRTVYKYDMPITASHAKSCVEQETYLQPCKKCMAKINKE